MAASFWSGLLSRFCCGGRSLPSPVLVLLVCLTVHTLILIPGAQADVCKGCFNGGTLFLPNSIFGPCRCRCKGNFAGPQCEFGKRSSGASLIRPDQDLLREDEEGDDPEPPQDDDKYDTRLDSKLGLLREMWMRLKVKSQSTDPEYRKRASGSHSGSNTDTMSSSASNRRFQYSDDWL